MDLWLNVKMILQDRDTSGLMVLGLGAKNHRSLSMQFEQRTVSKTYHALVNGWVEVRCLSALWAGVGGWVGGCGCGCAGGGGGGGQNMGMEVSRRNRGKPLVGPAVQRSV